MNISKRSTKFKSQECTVLRSGLKRLVASQQKKIHYVRKEFKKITELCGNIMKLKGKSSGKIRRVMLSSTTLQLKNEKEREYQPMSRGEVRQLCSPASQFSLTLTYSPAKFLLELGRHNINRTTVSRTFR